MAAIQCFVDILRAGKEAFDRDDQILVPDTRRELEDLKSLVPCVTVVRLKYGLTD